MYFSMVSFSVLFVSESDIEIDSNLYQLKTYMHVPVL